MMFIFHFALSTSVSGLSLLGMAFQILDVRTYVCMYVVLKIMSQPHRKACKLNFYWKICGHFFKAPLQGQKF